MAEPGTGLPLPHAYPFLLLDRIIEVQQGTGAVAVKNLTRSDPLLDGDGYLPPVLLAEALAQCAGIAVLGTQPGRSALLARLDRFRVSGCVGAGAQLRVSVRVVRILGTMAKVRGIIRVDGRRRAAGDVVLQLGSALLEREGQGAGRR